MILIKNNLFVDKKRIVFKIQFDLEIHLYLGINLTIYISLKQISTISLHQKLFECIFFIVLIIVSKLLYLLYTSKELIFFYASNKYI